MNMFKKNTPAILALTMAFSSGIASANVIANESTPQLLSYVNQVQWVVASSDNVKSDIPQLTSTQLTHNNLERVSRYDSYLPSSSKAITKGTSLFKFFTRFNDNLQLFMAWLSSSDKANENEYIVKQTHTPSKQCN